MYYPTIRGHDELSEVPSDVTSVKAGVGLEVLINRVGVGSIYVNLFE
jgi:hypothetical protein